MPPLPITAGQALLRNLGNEAKALIQRDNNPLLDPGGFLADPDTPPLSQQPAKALGRAICRAWARRPGDSNNPAADRLYGGACNEYLDTLDELPEPGVIGRPFEGGQCSAVYTISYTLNPRNPEQTTGFLQARGPIAGIRAEQAVSGSWIATLGCHGLVLSGNQNCRSIADQGFAYRNIGGANAPGDGPGPRINSVTPCGLDNCGDPAPIYEGPFSPTIVVPIVPVIIDLPDIGEVNVDVNILPDATINLCSEDLDTCVTIAPPGGGDDGGGGVGPDDLVPDGGLAGSPADTGNGGVASGEAPPGNELVGVRVEVLEAPIGFNQYANNAAVVYRGIGYVRMGYTGRLALDVGASAVISPQFFLAPVRGLTAWEHRANTGFINRVTPFYRELPS